MMKRILIAALFFCSVSLTQAANPLRIDVAEDVHRKIHALIDTGKLREGMNLVTTTPTGEKLWADVKKEGQFVVMSWVVTDSSDRRLPTSEVVINFGPNASPRSDEKWLVCTEPPNGPRKCTEVPCVPRFPCPKWICGVK